MFQNQIESQHPELCKQVFVRQLPKQSPPVQLYRAVDWNVWQISSMCNVGEIIAELLNEIKDTHSVSQLDDVLDSDTVSKAQL